MKNLMLFFLFVGISLFPLYYFTSGTPQISHFILMAFSIIAVIVCKFRLNVDILFASLLVMILVREIIAVALTQEFGGLVTVMFFIFNFIIYTALTSSASNIEQWRPGAIDATVRKGILIAISIALISIFASGGGALSGDSAMRQVGTFRNPNQLGYFALCAAGVLVVLRVKSAIKNSTFMVFLAATLMLTVYSMSKAALVSIAVVFLMSIWFFLPKSRFKNFFFTVGFVLVLSLFGILISSEFLASTDLAFVNRVSAIGSDNDDNFMSRGYLFVFDMNPVTFLFGLDSLHRNEDVQHEVHSTFFSIFVYYGLFGFMSFLGFYLLLAYRFFKSYGFASSFMVFMPSFLYGITHNGSRFSIFWILLAFAYISAQSKKAKDMCTVNIKATR
jgi:hypothetical protein